MVSFLKENGFPMTIHIETLEFEDQKEGFKGYESTFIDGNNNLIYKFHHNDLRARIHWTNGFFCALRKYNTLL